MLDLSSVTCEDFFSLFEQRINLLRGSAYLVMLSWHVPVSSHTCVCVCVSCHSEFHAQVSSAKGAPSDPAEAPLHQTLTVNEMKAVGVQRSQ